jgi:GNAT superfamily N-acetyltransferase
MTTNNPITVREATPEDMPFIFSSWYTAHRPHAKHVAIPEYNEGQNRLMRGIASRASIVVAASADYPDEILGYCVSEGDALHFLYVKSVYRGMGIARGLVSGKFKWYTFWMGEKGRSFAEKFGLTYNPYLTNREGLT